MATNDRRPIAVDLFAGAGGMTLGFEKAGFDVLAAVELDPIHASVHEYNFPFWTTICKSVTETTAREIRELSAIGDRPIDVVFGGPPCQGFSLMGKRNIDDDRNSLVSHFLRLVVDLRPKFFVMENVRGITVGKHQKILHQIIDEFQSHGYQVAENYQVLNAANYGVPQNRHRLFLMGCQKSFTLPNYPQLQTQPAQLSRHKSAQLSQEPNHSCSVTLSEGIPKDIPADIPLWYTAAHMSKNILAQPRQSLYAGEPRQHADSQNAPSLLASYSVASTRSSNLSKTKNLRNTKNTKNKEFYLPSTPTVQDAIGDIPEANHYPELKLRDWVVAEYGHPSEYVRILRNLKLVDHDYSYGREYNQSLLTCSRRTKHTAKTIARFAATHPGKSDRISHFHRLDLNGLCTTLRAGTPSNRGAFTSPRPIHPVTPRCITVREAARLHSYPDWFMFHATKWHGFRQIGNSVPPLLAQAVAREIIQALEIVPVKPSQIYNSSGSFSLPLLHFTMSQAEQYQNLETIAIARRTKVKSNYK